MTSTLVAALRAGLFVVLALAFCGLVFELAGYSAVAMFQSIAEGAFLSQRALMNSLRWTLPIFLMAAGVIVSFRAGFFNIGAQGQFYMGAIGGAFAAEWLAGYPAILVVPLVVIASIASGALWALWPGILRVRFGTDEVITTLMANFIATILLSFVTSGPLKDPSGTGQSSSSRPVDAAYRLSDSAGLSPTIVIVVVVAGIAVWVLVNRTAFGLLSGLVGRNPVMMRWQGANLQAIGLASFAVAGALAGLAASLEFLGPNGRIVSGFLPAHGFTAVLVALVAGLSIGAAAFVSLFFGGLAAAALYLPVMAGLPAAAIAVINAAIALFITARSTALTAWLGGFVKPVRGS
jgi:simple sugar transport system permease protein